MLEAVYEVSEGAFIRDFWTGSKYVEYMAWAFSTRSERLTGSMNQFETFVAAVLGGGLSVWGGHLMAAPTPAVLLGTVLSVWGGVLVGNPIIAGLRREHGAGSPRGSNGMKLNLKLRLWPFGRNGNGKHATLQGPSCTGPVAPCKEWLSTGGNAGACKEWRATQHLWSGNRHSRGLI